MKNLSLIFAIMSLLMIVIFVAPTLAVNGSGARLSLAVCSFSAMLNFYNYQKFKRKGK